MIRGLLAVSLWLYTAAAGGSAAIGKERSVPLCSGVKLSASYLASVGDQGPGFRFTLWNRTGRAIRLAAPIPSSAHWYARVHGRWLWRASNGAGGSLLNAGNEHGRVIVYPSTPGPAKLLTVQPHQSLQWNETQEENSVLAYKPGCKQCSYPGESEYRVVFAYAYAANKGDAAGLLACGLRSIPVPMPPKS